MKRFAKTLCLLLALCLPLGGLAVAPGEAVVFYEGIGAEYFDILSVQFTRVAREYVALELLIRARAGMTETEQAALASARFYWLAQPEDAHYLERLILDAPATPTVNGEAPDKTAYIAESQWQGITQLPDTLYVLPYYEALDEYGEVLVFHRGSADEDWTFEDIENVKPPLTDGEGRAHGNG